MRGVSSQIMTPLITEVRAFPISFRIPKEFQLSLGIGTTIKRDAVLVRVATDNGLVGWGEAHAGRAPSAIASLINQTLAAHITGMPALDPETVWEQVYRLQLASHGTGAAAAIALSGIDLALWDIRGQHAEQPVHALLNAPACDIQAYAGGISLGFSPPAELVSEAQALVARGFSAIKLRVGDSVERDTARIEAVRAALGPDITIMVDANTAYTLADVEQIADTLVSNNIHWLEEPFPEHDFKSYRAARAFIQTPLAAGENHYTRFAFERALDDGALDIWQPDLSKTGGLTEGLRIAAMGAAAGIEIHPHTSLTSINMAASLHLLCAIPNRGYFEADVSQFNPWRDGAFETDLDLHQPKACRAPTTAGLGVNTDDDLPLRFPVIDGAGYL